MRAGIARPYDNAATPQPTASAAPLTQGSQCGGAEVVGRCRLPCVRGGGSDTKWTSRWGCHFKSVRRAHTSPITCSVPAVFTAAAIPLSLSQQISDATAPHGGQHKSRFARIFRTFFKKVLTNVSRLCILSVLGHATQLRKINTEPSKNKR